MLHLKIGNDNSLTALLLIGLLYVFECKFAIVEKTCQF